MVIEGEGEPNAGALHGGEARGVDRGKLEQVVAPEVRPGGVQVTEIATGIFAVPGLLTESFHGSAMSRFALRSKNVNISMTTEMDVFGLAPVSRATHCA